MVGVGAMAVAQTTDEPPLPPWVNQDGTVNASLMPAQLPMVGPDGALLRDANGNPVMFDTANPPGEPSLGTSERRTFGPDEEGIPTETIELGPVGTD
jgi:hypothetical protein